MFELAGLATGIIGGIGKLFGRGAANRKLQKLQAQDPVYKGTGIPEKQYGYAATLLNSRMPGIAEAMNGVNQGQINFQGNVNKNAASGAQALALGGAGQAQATSGYQDLATLDAQDYQRRFANYMSAGNNVVDENRYQHQDDVRRFGDKMQIQGAKNENTQNSWGDISNLGFGLADFGMAQQNGQQGMGSGFGSLFGGGNNRTMADMPRNFYNPQRLNYYGNGG